MALTKRIRASTPRTTSGCLNCRTRRIKCDEKRPACERCVRSGWVCSGYIHGIQTGQSIEPTSATVTSGGAAAVAALSISEYSLPFKVPGSKEERRALHYFANFAAADVSGYLPSDFWSRTVLQRCQHDVPVRHAAVALGRAHMEYITATDTSYFDVSDQTAATHGKALKAVRNYLGRTSNHDRSMVLICSIIFYCFELMRSKRRTALQHLDSATKILRTWYAEQDRSHASNPDCREELFATYVRMELQATYYDDGRLPKLRVEECDAPGASAAAFTSLKSAEDSLFSLIHSCSVYLVQSTPYKFADASLVPEYVSAMRDHLVKRCDAWARSLILFCSGESNESSHLRSKQTRQHIALAVLKLHWQTARLLLLHSLQDEINNTAPSFDQVAEEHLRLAKEVINTPMQPEQQIGTQRGERSFSLHLGIITPLFLLAVKTENSRVREAAVELLKAAKGRREGFHDAEVTANLITALDNVSQDSVVTAAGRANNTTPALEWSVDPVMNVQCWENDSDRIDGWERLWWTAAA